MDEKHQCHRFRFGLRSLFELIAVVAFILTLLYYRTTAIQHTGRYQYYTQQGSILRYVLDTQTGQLWRVGDEQWYDEGKPPKN